MHRYIQFLFCISARFAIPSDHASPIGFCRPPHLRARLYYHIFTRKPAFPVVQVVTRRSAIRHHTHLFVSKPHAATASAMRLLLLAPSPDLLCGPAAMNLIFYRRRGYFQTANCQFKKYVPRFPSCSSKLYFWACVCVPHIELSRSYIGITPFHFIEDIFRINYPPKYLPSY